MAPPSLSSLPTELLVFVVDRLDQLRDLAAFARTNRRFHSIANHVVYKRVVAEGNIWPLAWAAHCGVVGTLKRVLAAGVQPDYPFVDCLGFDDWKRIIADARRLVPLDPHPRPPSKGRESRTVIRHYTALHLAVLGGHDEIVRILLDHGAKLDATCENLCDCTRLGGLLNETECPEPDPVPRSWSPLHLALCHFRPDTAKLLLSRGASHLMEPLEAQDGRECATALHHAAAAGLSGVVRYLVDNGIQKDVEVRDAKTLTPLYYAYAESRWESTFPLLLELGGNIDVDIKLFLPYSTITPLGEACRLGHFAKADRLLEFGADAMRGFIATMSGKGLSPLHMCCMPSARPASYVAPEGPARVLREREVEIGCMKTISNLISRGAQLDSEDCYGDTPIIAAAQNHNAAALRALIAAGADVHVRNAVGRSALMQVIMGPHNPTGVTPQDPERLAETFRVLVDAGARVDERDAEGNTLFHLVFKRVGSIPAGQSSALRTLLTMPGGVRNLLASKNKDGHSAGQLAWQARNHEAFRILALGRYFTRALEGAN
ncbi:ankyrin repeat-containing domain protein [Echria macrotheca]|uniref:Ankyrin repeat-containing domain protein n=1 Tax=Echria macrotheca TaxID=438768 RepID=A0AAJ0BJB0_9PEZI|nr:ankyrin repeat-containing domain protein [Echria macrotheca]